MAPKKEQPDKAKIAAKKKATEDKTFGLKNKGKSAKVQKFVQEVQQSVKATAIDRKTLLANEAREKAKKDKKEAEERAKREMVELLGIRQPKVPAGVDPKSIVCEFFRHGQCQKGFKCKFSHDLSVERKTAKIDLFSDRRGDGEDKEGEAGMEDWDQETLEKVIREKHGGEKPSNATAIICKFFLDAVEKGQYGWFWKCPNGGECKYKHALPPGYIMKSQMKELLAQEAAKNNRDMAEVIEEERAKVDAKTPVTEATFGAWHAKKAEARRAARAEVDAARRKKGVLNGREIFMQEGFIAQDDAGAADDYNERDDNDDVAINEMFAQAARQQAAARAAAGSSGAGDGDGAGAGPSSSGGASGAGPSGGGGAGGVGGVTTTLSAAHAAVFEGESSEEVELTDDDDDIDPAALAALEARLQGAKV